MKKVPTMRGPGGVTLTPPLDTPLSLLLSSEVSCVGTFCFLPSSEPYVACFIFHSAIVSPYFMSGQPPEHQIPV